MNISWGGMQQKTAILIPTRGRADFVLKTWTKRMPFLNDPDVYIGIEHREKLDYAKVKEAFPNANYLHYTNTAGSVAVAREMLRIQAVNKGVEVGKIRQPVYQWFVVTDDNAIYTQESLHHLVQTAASWPDLAIVAGMHNTAAHFDRTLIADARSVGEFRSYSGVSMMFQVYPRALYSQYSYPMDAFGLDDRHLVLWAIHHGQLRRDQFRVAMSAPFTKSRYQVGGQGSMEERAEKNGRAIARLALDFPKLVGMAGTLRLPWQMIFKSMGGDWSMDRLAGGAMRKEGDLLTPRVKVRRR